jgi:hypothetical protein
MRPLWPRAIFQIAINTAVAAFAFRQKHLFLAERKCCHRMLDLQSVAGIR